jgi:hypothetical protein
MTPNPPLGREPKALATDSDWGGLANLIESAADRGRSSRVVAEGLMWGSVTDSAQPEFHR